MSKVLARFLHHSGRQQIWITIKEKRESYCELFKRWHLNEAEAQSKSKRKTQITHSLHYLFSWECNAWQQLQLHCVILIPRQRRQRTYNNHERRTLLPRQPELSRGVPNLTFEIIEIEICKSARHKVHKIKHRPTVSNQKKKTKQFLTNTTNLLITRWILEVPPQSEELTMAVLISCHGKNISLELHRGICITTNKPSLNRYDVFINSSIHTGTWIYQSSPVYTSQGPS